MLQLLLTDFIKNRSIRLITLLLLIIELISFGTINQTLVLFGLPYCSSVVLNYLFHRQKIELKPYISAQYRSKK